FLLPPPPRSTLFPYTTLFRSSFSTVRSGFFHHSSFSFKIHRELPWNLAVAYGWEDAIRTKGTDGGTSMYWVATAGIPLRQDPGRSEEHTSELQSQSNLVCRLL